jgi:predicted MPP superfamily phosphohydrolase
VKRVLVAAALALTALGIWAFAIEPASLRTRAYELAIPGWPAECAGVRVAVLADLHVGSPWNGLERLAEVVAETNAAHPDLVLLAGDYVEGVAGGRKIPPEPIAGELRALGAPLGTWAVLGNHDAWLGEARVRAALEGAGIGVLHDQAAAVERGACGFWLAGISDLWTARHAIETTLEHVTDARAVLALTHNPDIFPDVPARASLTIAGHTHGGQVWLPLLGRPIVPSSYGDRFAIGHVVEDGRHLFVSPGIGTSIVPVRFLVPPEISLLTLRSGGSR